MKTKFMIYNPKIEKIRKLLRIEAEKNEYHKEEGGFEEIRIVTDKGCYCITGCEHCKALFVEKKEEKNGIRKESYCNQYDHF